MTFRDRTGRERDAMDGAAVVQESHFVLGGKKDMAGIIKVWLREPRRAWKNDGGAIPHGMRGQLKRRGIRRQVLWIINPPQPVRKGHWVVLAGGQAYTFSAAQMKRLYSRVPL